MPTATHELRDTYHAALQHGHVDPDDEDLVVGVVRRPVYGIENYLDRNVPALAPPDDLLNEFERVVESADETTHDEAWAEVEFDERYRDHLRDPEPRRAMDDLLAELESRDVWLVCYENTDQKRCHRTILKTVLEERTGEV
ncbi:DUF488 domain-containing protein [Halorussus salinisoli]|uniref:DUF488 domain-containing protein n=1 Tax=Halorussus salinisoli TaxID=2558242 RepID=UPI0010C22C7E|nr:DUF488 domain-containing protein [Halorussus salinisoli]